MRPSIILDVSGDFETIDSIVALQMGFSTIDDMGSFSRAESRALGRLGFALTELSTGITKINDYLIFNCLPSEDIMNTAVYCELLAAEVKRFSGLVFPDAGSTVAWEMRRQSICFSLYTVNQLISSLSATSSHSIVPLEEKNWQKLLSKDVGGRLTAEMFSSGVLLSDACAASQSLLAYCNQHQTEPSKLIPAELKKIHPILGTKTLDLLILLTSPSISATPGGSPLKARIITGTQRIRKGLNSLTPFAAPFSAFLLGVSISTCGVKTGLQSDAPDVRPEIPFYPLKPATLSLGEGPKSKSGVKVLDQKVRPNANSE